MKTSGQGLAFLSTHVKVCGRSRVALQAATKCLIWRAGLFLIGSGVKEADIEDQPDLNTGKEWSEMDLFDLADCVS